MILLLVGFFSSFFFIVNIIIVNLGKIQEIQILFQLSGRNIFPGTILSIMIL